MRRTLDVILLLIVVMGAGYVYLDHAQLLSKVRDLVYGAPCSRPETYSIGELDPRFNLSQAQAEALLERASSAWNAASGKDLLEYVPQGGQVTVDFQYDYRQNVTNQLSSLNSTISQNSESYTALRDQYDTRSAQLSAQKSDISAQQTAYQQALSQYNQNVEAINQNGDASPSQARQLESQRQSLEAQSADIQQEINSYNASAQSLNALAQEINGQASSDNQVIANYNSLASSTGPEFTEGQYVTNGITKEIDIYQYSDTDKLIRVIEHEFGHSLGLNHVADPNAIMYPTNSGSSLMPDAADLAELARACSS